MKIHVDGKEISIKQVNEEDYISLTDMVRDRDRPSDIIQNWIRTRTTINFLSEWEMLSNPDFNHVVFNEIKNEVGELTFTMSIKEWIERTGAIGIISKPGRYGGTFAHRDIAFEFGTRISAKFKILLIREFQQLKIDEAKRLQQNWDIPRFLSKIGLNLQNEIIKTDLLPRLEGKDKFHAYASEADLLNMVIFGMSAKEYRETYPTAKGNLRDQATEVQLIVLSYLEAINAHLIKSGASQQARFNQLAKIAVYQLEILSEDRRLEE